MPLEYNGALLYSAEYAICDGQWCDGITGGISMNFKALEADLFERSVQVKR